MVEYPVRICEPFLVALGDAQLIYTPLPLEKWFLSALVAFGTRGRCGSYRSMRSDLRSSFLAMVFFCVGVVGVCGMRQCERGM